MNISNSNNLGKPYLKLDFESNQELFEFAKSYNIPVDFDENSLTYKKVKSKSIGATEILEQNKLYTGKSNFYPTYKILNNYSHLIAPAQNNMFGFNQNGNLTDTINYIKDIVQKYNWQVEKLTNHLCKDIAYPKTFGTYGAQMFNIWHWLKSNIPFRIEDDEELRTPARSYHIDRFTGIDCDDYSIFAACILTQLGYNYDFYVVAFNNNKNFGHIYVVCNGYVIDGVMKEFNKHPDNITKKMIIPMKIKLLGNIPVDVSNLDTLSQNLINQYSELQDIANTCNDANIRNKANRELRKTSSMLMLKGIDEQIDWINAMPLISDINENLEPVFISGEAQELTEDYFNELDNLRSLGSLEAVKTLRQRFDNVKQKITQNKDERKENRQDKKKTKNKQKKTKKKTINQA